MALARRVVIAAVPTIMMCVCAALVQAGDPPAPPTEKKPVVDEYHGKKITDDYRWLEIWDDHVKTWSSAQSAHARRVLDTLPSVPAIRQRVTELLGVKYSSYGGLDWRKGVLFATKFEPPKQQSFLVVLNSVDDTAGERVLVDPNKMDA